MKGILFLTIVLMLSGCKDDAVPISINFPKVPADLLEACPDLKQIDTKTTKLSEVIGVVSENYSQYHACRLQVDNWIEWYNTQKKIFDGIKK